MTDTAGPPPDWAESWLKGQPDSKALLKSLADVREWLKGLPDTETSLRNEPVAEAWLKSMPPDTERLINSLPDFAAWFEHWPDAEAWLREPEILVRDINTLHDCLLDLTDFEIDSGRYFNPKSEPRFGRALMPLTCMRCDEFVIQVMAANCIQPLPLSPERLRRVGEILKTWDAHEQIETVCIMEDGQPGTRYTWEPRFTWEQRLGLCREAFQIIAGEVAAAKKYARLKTAQNRPAKGQRGGSGAKSGTPTDDERRTQGKDTTSSSANTEDIRRAYLWLKESGQKPTKENVRQTLRDWEKTIGNDRLNAELSRLRQKSKSSPPNKPD